MYATSHQPGLKPKLSLFYLFIALPPLTSLTSLSLADCSGMTDETVAQESVNDTE
jgi:hypothetical protein